MDTQFFDRSTFETLGSVLAVFAAVLGVAMYFLDRGRKSKYDQERRMIELEYMRRSFESQMHTLNAKMLATEDRWRDVNHMIISAQNRQPDASFPLNRGTLSSSFLNSLGIQEDQIVVDDKFVFVLTPFHPRYSEQFDVIKQTCSEVGLNAMRGDEEYISGDVYPHMIRLILKARLVIANIDGRNPNVFYELGVAQALGKTTLLVAPKPEEVPFDLRTKRIVIFSSLAELKERLKDELARAVISGPNSQITN